MQNQAIIYSLAGLVIGVLITAFVASNAVNNNMTGIMSMMGMRQMMNQGGQNNMMGNIDSHFIEQMIPHHEDAITMAKLAQEKATHQEIKTLSLNIIDSQGKEIDQMKVWYKDWYGRDLPTGSEVMNTHGMVSSSGMHMGMMGNEMDITRLENAADFDKVFIEDMIPHHQMAVMMASMLKNGTQREEMKNLADDIIAAQTKEIDQMRQWYDNWY
jgi:uncharacterized protein (DUF305 family)